MLEKNRVTLCNSCHLQIHSRGIGSQYTDRLSTEQLAQLLSLTVSQLEAMSSIALLELATAQLIIPVMFYLQERFPTNSP